MYLPLQEKHTYKKPKIWKYLIVLILVLILLFLVGMRGNALIVGEKPLESQYKLDGSSGETGVVVSEEFTAYITGYNTVKEQTDSTPCYTGSEYICGRDDVVACPRRIEKGTWIVIMGLGKYQCIDRLNIKYDHRIDVSCDKDFECPYLITGWKLIRVLK